MRNLLHINKLDEFKSWLTAQGIEHRPGRGEWEVLQVNVNGVWPCVFRRINMPEHYTTDRRLDGLVRRFCKEPK